MALQYKMILATAQALFRLIRTHAPRTLVVSSLVGVLAGLANTAAIALVHRTITADVPPRLELLWVFLGLCLTAHVARTFSQYLLWTGCLRSTVNLLTGLTSRILATPLARLEAIGPSRILTALERDCISLTDAVVALPILLLNCTVLLGCALYLAWLHPVAAAAFVALVAMSTFSTLFVVKRTSGIQASARAGIDQLFEYLRSVLAGVKELQLNSSRRRAFARELRNTAETVSRLEVIVQTIYVGSTAWFQLLFVVPIGVLIIVLPNFFPISMSALSAYALVLLYMLSPISALSGQLERIGRGAIAFGNIESLGLTLSESSAEASVIVRPRPWSRLALARAVFRYPPANGQAPFQVGPLDVEFQRGETVFITGGNGSGKTTLAKLLCGLYLPDEGGIELDGVSVGPDALEEYRQNFSAVFWDFHIFKRLFGLESPEMESLARTALVKLQLDKKVDVKAGEFTSVNLSQGQRKRLALLVGMLENRDVYVFDEWAADQDQEFRKHFYTVLLPTLRSQGKTVFVITHDDRYFAVADRVLKLDLGVVVTDMRRGQAVMAGVS